MPQEIKIIIEDWLKTTDKDPIKLAQDAYNAGYQKGWIDGGELAS